MKLNADESVTLDKDEVSKLLHILGEVSAGRRIEAGFRKADNDLFDQFINLYRRLKSLR